MADMLLCELVAGQLHHSVILSALSSNAPISFKDVKCQISEFIPHFLAYLREKLTQPFESQGCSSYYSPRQREDLKRTGRNKIKQQINGAKSDTPGSRSARLSLNYASSSPLKKVNFNASEMNSTMELSGISPIKSANTKRVKPRKVATPTGFHSNNINRSDHGGFELTSTDDFPSMSATVTAKNPRRITPTPIGSIQRNNRTNSNNNNCTPANSSTTTKSNFEAHSFLEESNFEVQNADPSFESLFQNGKRFSKSAVENSPRLSDRFNDCCEKEFGSLSLSSNNNNKILETTPTKQTKEVLDLDNVEEEKEILNVLSEIYSAICTSNLVPNLTLELYFLFTVLTTRVSLHQLENTDKFSHPFINIECFVYFAVTCLERLRRVVFLLDRKSLQLLFENSRVQQFTSLIFLEQLENEITADTSAGASFTSALIKSPVTGIAFQTESDNRKSFTSDRHFYSFSKKRDAFYSLVREWEENYSDPDWNLSHVLTKRVNELMRHQDDCSNDYQFARLFVAQLLEMRRSNFHDKTDEPETSDGVLLELKKRNPNRFQSLQERLTKPSFSCDPCPKLNFSKVEEFFKQFIIVADSYCFNKCLSLVLVSSITDRDSKTFGLNQQINVKLGKSDFSESLWQDIKSTILELRLLAKFLGFVLFLPYHTLYLKKNDMKNTRELLAEPLFLKTFLSDAWMKHRLLITVPWTIDFLSMADKNAFGMSAYSETLSFLTCLHRYMNTRLLRDDDAGFLLMSLTLHIGWLFDQHPSHTFNFYDSVCSPSVWHYEELSLSTADVGLDDIIIVDKMFLYSLCPYLKVISRPLNDFKRNAGLNTSGNFRKITPVRSTDVLSVDLRSNLKTQLLDGFLKYIPNHVKDCITYVTDRFFMNIKHHVCEVIFPSCQQQALGKVKEYFSFDVADEEINKDSLKLDNKSLYHECVTDGKNEARTICQEYVFKYLNGKIETGLQCLLPEDTNKKLVEVSSKVVRHNVCIRIQEWLTANRDLYSNGFDVLYNRHINHVIKTQKDIKKSAAEMLR